jgi:AAA family ATPase
MAAATAFSLRPLERSTNSLDQSAFRVHLSAAALKSLGFSSGDVVRISTTKGFHGYAIAWPASQTNPGSKPIARIADLLREKYELNLTDNVFFEKANEAAEPLQAITIRFAQSPEVLSKCGSTDDLKYLAGKALGKTHLFPCRCLLINYFRRHGYHFEWMRLRHASEGRWVPSKGF